MQLTGFGSANTCGWVTGTVTIVFCPCCFVNESKSHFTDGFSKFMSGNAKPSSSDFGDRFLNEEEKQKHKHTQIQMNSLYFNIYISYDQWLITKLWNSQNNNKTFNQFLTSLVGLVLNPQRQNTPPNRRNQWLLAFLPDSFISFFLTHNFQYWLVDTDFSCDVILLLSFSITLSVCVCVLLFVSFFFICIFTVHSLLCTIRDIICPGSSTLCTPLQ